VKKNRVTRTENTLNLWGFGGVADKEIEQSKEPSAKVITLDFSATESSQEPTIDPVMHKRYDRLPKHASISKPHTPVPPAPSSQVSSTDEKQHSCVAESNLLDVPAKEPVTHKRLGRPPKDLSLLKSYISVPRPCLTRSHPNQVSSARELDAFLRNFHLESSLASIDEKQDTEVAESKISGVPVNKYINEFWTAKQRDASSLHEVSYRACFKPQLPRFFIDLLTAEGDVVYDPFGGRGTTIVEANLAGRVGISNDINPLSEIFAAPRLCLPELSDIEKRLDEIPFDKTKNSDIDLSMFYHPDTLGEIVSLKEYLIKKAESGEEDYVDKWIRMVATNRLTGHSPGFFSVYTLPPNQAVSQERQKKINEKRNQIPDYRNVKKIILKKSNQLLSQVSVEEKEHIAICGKQSLFVNSDARYTTVIPDNTVQLTVTSPPFLNIVQYSADNWLRCWFNNSDSEAIGQKITMSRTVEQWSGVMGDVFKELYRITKTGGWVAFEVGEVRNGSISLDDFVVPLGINVGFSLFGVLVNSQKFTKTANIWGISNNSCGTNTNRIVIFTKESVTGA